MSALAMCVSNCSLLAWSCFCVQAKLPRDGSPEPDVELNPDCAQRWQWLEHTGANLYSFWFSRLHQQLPLVLRGDVIRAEILGNASIPQPHHFSCRAQCCTHMQWSSISHFFTSCWRDVFPSHAAAWLLSAGGTRKPLSACDHLD